MMYDAAYNFQGGHLCEDPMPRTIRIAVQIYTYGHFVEKIKTKQRTCQLRAIAAGLFDELLFCVPEDHLSAHLEGFCWQFLAEGLKERILFSAPIMGGKIR